MLKLNVNQEKQLTFEVQIGGVQSDKIISHLRIVIDEIEYGFPAIVGKESITVNLPPLKAVTAKPLKEGAEVEVKLEIIADGNYLTPWSDSFILSNPLVVEAKILDSEFKNPPAFKTRLVQEGKTGDRKQGVRIERDLIEEDEDFVETPKRKQRYVSESEEDDLTERIVNKLAEKLSKGLIEKKKFIKDEPIVDNDEEEDDIVEEQAPVRRPPVRRRSRKISTSEILNMTESDVYAYMERAGTKNEHVQKILYEQAEIAAGTSKPYKVLGQVIKILKNKK
jgi:hypothetical protein